MTIVIRCAAFVFLTTISLTAAAQLDVPSGTYKLDKTHGYITFTYTHLGFSNPQVGFDQFDVTMNLNADNPADSSLEVTINTASVNSRVEEFDEHLNGEKYFDTSAHPQATFSSTGITSLEDNRFDVAGELTIKGISHPVTLKTVINKAAMHPIYRKPTVGVSATTTVARSDWGMDSYAPAVSDEVTISIEVELQHQAEP